MSIGNGSIVENSTIEFKPTWYAARGAVVLLITVGIIISNVINLIVWKKNKRMPSATRLFLINLSTSDLMVGVFSTSLAIYPAFQGVWPYGDVWCQISGVVHGMSVTLSIWSIAMVGIDRYLAASHPYDYKTLMSRKRSFIIVACMWAASFITFIAPIFTKTDFIYYQYKNHDAFCGLHWEYPLYCIITAMYIPVASALTLVFTSVQIHRNFLANRRASKQGDKNPDEKNKAFTDKQAKKMAAINQRALLILVAASVVFVSFWGPYVILNLVLSFTSGLNAPEVTKFSVIWIANANSMVNVIVYSLTNKSFQDEARELLLKFSPTDNLDNLQQPKETGVEKARDREGNSNNKERQKQGDEGDGVKLNDIKVALDPSELEGVNSREVVQIHL